MKEYDEEKLKQILSLSFLAEFHQLPCGIDTEIHKGGQKQKITIARMLMHNPDVIIFDESTSALDSRSENEIVTSISNLIANKIVITISHRMSTIRDVDLILVLKDGSISEIGID